MNGDLFFCTDIPTLLRWRWWILILLAVWLLALAVIGVLRRRWGVALAFAVSFVHCKGKREKETGSCQAWTRGAGYYFFATAGFWCQTFFPSLSALLFLRTDQPSHQTIIFADNSTLQQLVFNNKIVRTRVLCFSSCSDAAVLIDLISWGGEQKGWSCTLLFAFQSKMEMMVCLRDGWLRRNSPSQAGINLWTTVAHA